MKLGFPRSFRGKTNLFHLAGFQASSGDTGRRLGWFSWYKCQCKFVSLVGWPTNDVTGWQSEDSQDPR